MLLKFQKYLTEKKLFTSSDKILLTVSGGKDSVFMVNLFLQSNLNFGIAHCNFKAKRERFRSRRAVCEKYSYRQWNSISYS